MAKMDLMFDDRHVIGAESGIPGEVPLDKEDVSDDTDSAEDDDEVIKAKPKKQRKTKSCKDDFSAQDEKNPFVCINLYTCSNLFSMDVDMYYLVDSGYPNRVGYLAPYKGTTYHLAEFRSVRRPPSGKFEVFNYLHSSLRNVIERTFGVLKQKWRILRDVPHFKVGSQTMIISACMTPQNFIRDNKLHDKEFDKCDDNENYMPAVSRSTPLLGDVVPTSSDEGNMNDM